MSARADERLSVLVVDRPLGRCPQRRRDGRAGRHDRGGYAPTIEDVLPSRTGIEHAEVVLHERLAVDGRAIVDEDPEAGPEAVDQRAAEAVGIEAADEAIR